ncbi:transglycosylase domain-containing protein [Ktedonosporobacter rubrisoli]|nr:penicillin-binding transpeptidase domain-containing protein [Ktedonosporobacter rubrisoli]
MYITRNRLLSLSRLSGILLLLSCILSACVYGGLSAPKEQQSLQAEKGHLQLYDKAGRLICLIGNVQQQQDCLKQNQDSADFITYALQELVNVVQMKPSALLDSGLIVTTTLDINLNKQAIQHARSYIKKIKDSHNVTNAAIVILDPHDSSIRTFLKNIDSSSDANYDVVTQAKRQSGSTFRPLVYAAAFDQGMSPGEVVNDSPIALGSPPYSPVNYDHKYHGIVSYRSALQNNYNIPAVKLLDKVGIDPFMKKMSALGIKIPALDRGYSLALGTTELPLLDMTGAYGTMANGGMYVRPHAIAKVVHANGSVLYEATNQGTPAMRPETAFMMTDVLSDNQARSSEFGLCSPLLLYTADKDQCEAGKPGIVYPAAAKSSYVNTFRDSLTIGYTSDFLTGVWVGNNDYAPMVNITGVDGAAVIWHDTMLLAEQGRPVKQFPGPPGDLLKKTISYPGLTTTDWYTTKQ